MTTLTKRIIDIINGIQPGKVMTYGQIAFFAGSPRAQRAVVMVIKRYCDELDMPWHRVINSKGELSVPDIAIRNLQAELLRLEGVEVLDYKVDLKRFQQQS